MAITWKRGTHYKVDAEKAHAAIEKIRTKNDGKVEAADVVKAAKGSRHILHSEFDWDDESAAHEHRLHTARKILQSFVCVREDVKSDRPQRVYEVTREPSEPNKRIRHAYRSVEDIMADPDTRAELLGRALRELVSFRDRYRDLQELAVVIRTISETLETVEVA